MMIRKLTVLLTISVSMTLSSSMTFAGDCATCDTGCASCNAGGCESCGPVCCPKCNCVCELKGETVDVEKTCFQVECKKICVPRFVLPWKKSCCDPCAHNGAWQREISVLKKEKYKCKKCEYTWTPKCDTCCVTCDSCCTSCDAGAVIETPAAVEQPTPASDGPALDVPPAPPAPSAAAKQPTNVRMVKSRKPVKISPATQSLQTALKKLRK